MKNPLVSVVVPNYNYAPYISRRLSTILQQTYRDIEVILLDDCSTDDSVVRMQVYKDQDSRITELEVNAKNSGSPFLQWEKGIRKASGKYVWIAEADDWAELNLLEKAVEQLEKDDEVALVKVDSLLVEPDGKPLPLDLDRWRQRKILEGTISVHEGKDFVRNQMYWINRIYNASGVVFRRSLVNDEMFQLLTIPNVSDWIFWSSVSIQGKVVEIHERLNRFCQQPKSLTHSPQAIAASSLNEALVMHTLQQMIHIPMCQRLWKLRKLIKHHRGTCKQKWQLLHYILGNHLLSGK